MVEVSGYRNFEFIAYIAKFKPKLLSAFDKRGRSIFAHAVIHRHRNMLRLVHQIDQQSREIITSRVDDNGETLLHFAAHEGPAYPGFDPAMKMRAELKWFKAVQKIMPKDYMQFRNNKGQTPQELFRHTHASLSNEAREWAKNTANSYTTMSALITTIMFAAAFTVPGGTKQDIGVPVFMHKHTFILFVASDILSMFASALSLLIFIGMTTASHNEDIFLFKLPMMLLAGVSSLLIAVIAMVLAFIAAVILIVEDSYVKIEVIILSGVTLIVIACLRRNLFPHLKLLRSELLVSACARALIRKIFGCIDSLIRWRRRNEDILAEANLEKKESFSSF